MKSCFLKVRPGPPPPPPCMALHSVLITTVQYRVCDIHVKGLWASSVRVRPLTCQLSHHFAYMKCFSLAYLYKRFQLLLGGKGRGGYVLQSLIMTTLLYQSILRMTLEIICIVVNDHYYSCFLLLKHMTNLVYSSSIH